jgi:poly-gamma-glutamate capsule biosynthesis protein CapA/YwtB (metallophosphatase superfamily)
MLNLETAITTSGSPMPGKQFTFRAPASALAELEAAGVDAVSMANNHAVDYGAIGLRDTLAAKHSSMLPGVGIGANAAEAFAPTYLDVRGTKVALVAASQVRELTWLHHTAVESTPGIASTSDLDRLRAAVRTSAATADVVVVMMHWGTERTTCSDDRQVATAKLLGDDGADIIVGGHGHRPQGAGWLGTTFVGYGLGNFIWYQNSEPSSQSGVLTVTVDAQAARSRRGMPATGGDRGPSVVTAEKWTPMLVGADGIPRRPEDELTTDRLMRAWEASIRCGGLSSSAE